MRKSRRDGTKRTERQQQLSLETLEPRILLDAGFGVQQVVENYSSDVNPQSVFAADLDGDGDQDVLAGTQGPKNRESQSLDKVVWFENLDEGGFGSEQVITTAVDRTDTVRAADLDGDNDQDVLSASYADDKVAWYENQGDGTFSDQKVVSNMVNEAGPLDTADMDNDGDVDILAGSPGNSWIGWYPNTDGQGSFGDRISVSGGTDMVKSVQAADLNDDNRPDVVASYGAGTADQLKLSWWANQGGGSFGREQTIDSGIFGMHGVETAHVNADSYPDVVLAAGDPTQKIVWYANQAGSGFGSQQLVSEQVGEPWDLYSADLDMDNDDDLLCADYWHGISWFENTGGSFAGKSVIENDAEWALSVHAADMDGDTDLDALGTWEKGDKVALFSNTVIGPPQVTSLSVSPETVVKPNNLTLTASGVDDPDGSVSEVEFYLDDGDQSFNPVNDILLVTDGDGADGWQVTGTTQGTEWTGGQHTLFARAQDNDGKWSTPASTQVTVQVRPTVDSVSQEPDPVSQGREVEVSVQASDEDGNVQQVVLYEDTDGNGTFDPGTDEQLASDSDGSDGWDWTSSTSGLSVGTHTYFVLAQDNDELWSGPFAAELEVVENQPPVISSFSDGPDPVVRPNELTLTADASDPDGTLQGVEFFVDKNDNGTIEPQEDVLLASDSDGSDGWSWTGSTGGWPVGTHTYMARALDDSGGWSDTVTTQGTVENSAPIVTSFTASPAPVHIGADLSLNVEAADADGDVGAVGFYYDRNGDGAAQNDELMNVDSDGSDGWNHTVQTGGLSPGTYPFLARAIDNLGAASSLETTSVEADYELIDTQTTNGSTVSFYDTDASDGKAELDIAWGGSSSTTPDVIVLGRPIGEKTVYTILHTGAFQQSDDIGIVVEGNSQVSSMNWHTSIGFLLSEGQVNYAHFGGGMRGARVGGLATPGGWQVPEDVDNDGSSGDVTAFYTPSVCTRFDAVSGSAGTGIMGDIVASRGLGVLSASNTHFGGDLRIGGTAAELVRPSARIVVRGGNLQGKVSTDGDISSLITVASYDRDSGEYQGGHIKGDLHIAGDVGVVTARGGNIEGLLEVGGNIRVVKSVALAGSGGGISGGVDAEGNITALVAYGGDVGSLEASDIRVVRAVNGRIVGNVEARDGGIGSVVVRPGNSEAPSGEAWGINGDVTATGTIGNISLSKRLDKASPKLAVDGLIEAANINRMTVRGGDIEGNKVHATSDIGWITVVGGDLKSDVTADSGHIRQVRVVRQRVRAEDGSLASIGGSISGEVDAGGRLGILSAVGGEVGIVDAGEIGRIVVSNGILGSDVTSDTSIGSIVVTRPLNSGSSQAAVNGSINAGSLNRMVVRGGDVAGDSIHATSKVGSVTVVGGDLKSDVTADSGDIRVLRVVRQHVRAGDGSLSSIGGSISGYVDAGGRMGVVSATGGEVGSVEAGEIGRIVVSNGILSGDVTARTGGIGVVSITKRFDSSSPMPAIGGSIRAQSDIGRLIARNGIVDLSESGRSIEAGKGIGLLYAGGLLGDSDDSTKEIKVNEGNLGSLLIVQGNIRGVAVDVNAGVQSDGSGNINRVLVRGADEGILKSHFNAEGNLQSLLVTRAWDVEASEWTGGRCFNTTVEAKSLGVVQVRGPMGEDDSDQDQDRVHARQGSFLLQHQGWMKVREGETPMMMHDVEISAG